MINLILIFTHIIHLTYANARVHAYTYAHTQYGFKLGPASSIFCIIMQQPRHTNFFFRLCCIECLFYYVVDEFFFYKDWNTLKMSLLNLILFFTDKKKYIHTQKDPTRGNRHKPEH